MNELNKLAGTEILVEKLILLEEYLAERYVASLKLIIVTFLAVGFYLIDYYSLDKNYLIFFIWLLGTQLLNSILPLWRKRFSRFLIYCTITIDAVCLVAMFAFMAHEYGFRSAVNNEVLVYAQIIFIAFQVMRFSKNYLLYALSLLVLGRLSIYLYVTLVIKMDVSYDGSSLSVVVRIIALSILVLIFLYTTKRTWYVGRKALFDYLDKNNLLNDRQTLIAKINHDTLTKLFSLHYFQEVLPKILKSAYKNKNYVSLMLIDIDNFKLVNDNFGHDAGDQVLKEVATTLQGLSPDGAVLARYGGDELYCLLPDFDKTSAIKLAEAFRLAIDNKFKNRKENVTLSIGVDSVLPKANESPAHLLAHADRAMYKSKKSGRNKVYYR